MASRNTPRAEERSMRRTAERCGYKLVKSRRRSPEASDFGGFGLIDPESNFVVFGHGANGFEATLDEIRSFLGKKDA